MAGKKYRRIWAVLMAAAFALTGCGNQAGNPTDDSPVKGEAAMGRYVEESYDLGTGDGRKGGIVRLEDGRLEAFDFGKGPSISEDEGKTWKLLYDDWAVNYSDGFYREAALSKTGEIFLSYTPFEKSAESEETTEETERSFEIRYALISPEGERRELELPLDQEKSEYLSKCWFTPDGKLLGNILGSVVEIDRETGDLKELFEADSMVELACFSNDRMAAFTRTSVWWYDLNTGEILEQDKVLNQFVADLTDQGNKAISYSGNNYSFLAALDEENNLYIACEQGIFRHVPGGSSLEQLLTGSLCTLGNPSEQIFGMLLCPEQEFLLMFGDSLSRFYYDADMPSVPEKELKVYSLKKNSAMQQAVSDYQKAHPEVYVNYTIGMTGMDGQTQEDAIKALNTEVLAGKGPDVLLLDGLPIDSYISKGMLADISGLVKETEEKEGLIDSIAKSYEQDGKICAVPVRFAVPVMLGPESLTKTVKDLGTLAGYMEELRKQQPEGSLLQTCLPESTLRLLAITSAPAWAKEDGTLDKDAVKEFLTEASRIYQAEKQGVTEEEIDEFTKTTVSVQGGDIMQKYYLQAGWNAQGYAAEPSKVAMGTTQGIMLDFSNIVSAAKLVEGTEFVSMPGQAQNVFLADTIAAISSKSTQMELAEDFVRELLSAKTMTALGDTGEGFAINDTAREQIYNSNEPGVGYGSMAVVKQDGTYREMDLYWPELTEMEQMTAIMETLKNPYEPGGFLEEEVISAGLEVLDGSMSVEQGIAQIEKKVQLYLAE